MTPLAEECLPGAKDGPLAEWREEHNASHRSMRARVVHTFARMKRWNVLRDCRPRPLRREAEFLAGSGLVRSHLRWRSLFSSRRHAISAPTRK
ncbi:hypothetical protein GCM10009602_47590 [Nocardiopsis tropica]